MMDIAVIGSGNIGGRLATVWALKGHRVILGTRNPAEEKIKKLIASNPTKISAGTVELASRSAEVILLAVPASNAYAVSKQLGEVKGKVIIDAMNAVFRKPEPYTRTSEAITAATGSDHIVKCFNSVGAENIDNPVYGNDRADMLLCGNYASDKAIVRKLAEDCGFNVYDIGGLDKEPLTEQTALLWASLATGAGLGRNIAFKVLRR
jgi:predicted dinucleotide-binding enzyme